MTLDQTFGGRIVALREKAQLQRSESWRTRQARLRTLRLAFVKRRAALQDALARDLGRAAAETDIVEYMPMIGEIDHAIARIGRWTKPQRHTTPISLFGARSEVLPQPKGVCLIMAPWNYPANLVIGPLISCIAAGNTAVVKPSELAPATCAYLRDLFAEAFEPDEVALIEGGPEVAESLIEERFDHVFFTGSPRVGRLVMAAAAKGPTSVTLELGGKSPAYVHKSADLADAAAKLVWGKFINAGQTCIAPDYVLADASIAEALKQALADRVRKIYPLETSEGRRGNDLTAIISERHAERLVDLISDARAKGAKIIVGGAADPAARFVAPTVLDGITAAMRLDQEEIFGPLLPVRTVADADAAIAHVNAAPPPLASYIFTGETDVADRFLAEAPAGGSCVNNALLQFANERLPFGGIGPSGIGRSHGKAGFEAFSNMHSVVRDRFTLSRLLFPPYNANVKRQLSFLLRLKGAA